MKTFILIMLMLFLLPCVSVAGDNYVERPVKPDELYELIETADRVVVTESAWDEEGYQAADKILYESKDRKDLNSLRESLDIIVPDRWFHCMCMGSPEIHLYQGDVELVSFTNHHGVSVRTTLWSGDANVADSDKWVDWFAERGMMGPRKEVDESRVRSEQRRIERRRWKSAMPESIKTIWQDALDQFGDANTKPLIEALQKEMPEQDKRILALLEWYGSGAGPWSGYPSYESAPEEMLAEYKAGDIVNVVEFNELSLAQKEGAARFFAGWNRNRELEQLPDGLKKELLEHVLQTDNEDNKARAKNAFDTAH